MPGPDRPAVAEAVLNRMPVVGPPTATQARAEQFRQKLAEAGPRSAIESMRERKPVERGKGRNLTEQNIGTEINPADGLKKRLVGTEVRRRYDQAERYRTLSEDYLEKGFDALSGGQKADAIRLASAIVRAWPEGEALLNSLPSITARDNLVANLLRKPEFAAKVRSLYENVSNQTALADLVSEKQTQFDEAKSREDAKSKEVTENTAELAAVNAELSQFETVGGVDGPRLAELKSIDLNTLSSELRGKQNDLDDVTLRRKAYENSRNRQLSIDPTFDTTTLDGQIAGERTREITLTNDRDAIQAKLKRKVDLEQEKQQFETSKKQLEEAKPKLAQELVDFTRARKSAQATLAGEQITRATQEEDFVNSLQNVFTEATIQYLEDTIQATEAAEQLIIAEEKAKAVDPGEKAVLDALTKRWDRRKGFNKAQIDSDSVALFDPTRGPKEVVRAILITGGLTPVEADAKVNDTAFMEKMQPQVVERLLTRKFQTGKISEAEALFVKESDWGAAAIDKAIANKKGLREMVDNLRAEGVLKGSLGQWFKEKSKGNLALFLLLIFGSIGTLGALPALMRGSEALKSE